MLLIIILLGFGAISIVVWFFGTFADYGWGNAARRVLGIAIAASLIFSSSIVFITWDAKHNSTTTVYTYKSKSIPDFNIEFGKEVTITKIKHSPPSWLLLNDNTKYKIDMEK